MSRLQEALVVRRNGGPRLLLFAGIRGGRRGGRPLFSLVVASLTPVARPKELPERDCFQALSVITVSKVQRLTDL